MSSYDIISYKIYHKIIMNIIIVIKSYHHIKIIHGLKISVHIYRKIIHFTRRLLEAQNIKTSDVKRLRLIKRVSSKLM